MGLQFDEIIKFFKVDKTHKIRQLTKAVNKKHNIFYIVFVKKRTYTLRKTISETCLILPESEARKG